MDDIALAYLSKIYRVEVWYIERMRQYGCCFSNAWVIDRWGKTATFGVGFSPEAAARDYIDKINGKKLEIDQREPVILVNLLDEFRD